jgi:hypothetical protein
MTFRRLTQPHAPRPLQLGRFMGLARSRTSRFFIFFFTALLPLTALGNDLPDPRLTPGAINPAVTQENLSETVCRRGYTKTIRPPAFFTNKLKREQIRQYGYADTNPRSYEEDHLIALSIGGAPDDPHNLWPQPLTSAWGASQKDELEFVLYKMLCNGEIALAEAQQAMASDWIAAWKKYVPTHPQYRSSHSH